MYYIQKFEYKINKLQILEFLLGASKTRWLTETRTI